MVKKGICSLLALWDITLPLLRPYVNALSSPSGRRKWKASPCCRLLAQIYRLLAQIYLRSLLGEEEWLDLAREEHRRGLSSFAEYLHGDALHREKARCLPLLEAQRTRRMLTFPAERVWRKGGRRVGSRRGMVKNFHAVSREARSSWKTSLKQRKRFDFV